MDSILNETVTRPAPNKMRMPRHTRNRICLILVIGILAIVYGFYRSRTAGGLSVWRPASSSDVHGKGGDLESMAELQCATRGEWIEVTGIWSKFGVLGAAFDGQKIVMSSGESAVGNLGCWISPLGRPMTGTCSEAGPSAGSNLPVGRTCSWQIVVQEISPTNIRGARMLKAKESDPGCAMDYPSLPSPFVWERPHGQEGRESN